MIKNLLKNNQQIFKFKVPPYQLLNAKTHFQYNSLNNYQQPNKILTNKTFYNYIWKKPSPVTVSPTVLKKRQENQQKLEEDENYVSLISQGIFPNWFISLSVLLSLNLGAYLIWNISEQKDSENLKGFIENHFILSNDQPQKKGEVDVKYFPNVIMSSFLHTNFLSLFMTLGGLWAFHRPVHNYLGIKKFWTLYLGAIFVGYIGDRFIFNQLDSKAVKQNDVLRRWNILKDQNLGYINIRNQGSKDSIMAMTAFVFSGLFLKNCRFIGKNYLYLFLAIPVYLAYDLSNYFYPKFRYHNGEDVTMLKSHISAFVFGTIFGIYNEISKQSLQFSNIDKNKIIMLFLYTTMLCILFAYLNEIRFFNDNDRMLMHRSKHRDYLLDINKQQSYLEKQLNQISTDIDSKQLSNLLVNLKQDQQKQGDMAVTKISKIINRQIKEYDERYQVLELLKKEILICEQNKHQSLQLRSYGFKNYYNF